MNASNGSASGLRRSLKIDFWAGEKAAREADFFNTLLGHRREHSRPSHRCLSQLGAGAPPEDLASETEQLKFFESICFFASAARDALMSLAAARP